MARLSSRVAVTVLAACWLAAAGCGLLPSSRSGSSEARAGTEVSVEVENHNWSDITVYLMAGGLPQRLGMVTALGSARLGFPLQWLNTGSGVRLRALPVAGQAFTTETILVQPGQSIFWTLENDLDASSISVF
ncbi:MAG: hypothetical protein ACREMZ_08835 [Gemmatimonadales bacterium]